MYFWPSASKTVIDKQQDLKFTFLNVSHIHESEISDVFEVLHDFDATD